MLPRRRTLRLQRTLRATRLARSMSKLGCRCGHIIVDQADCLPYKAEILSDQDAERVWDDTSAAVAAYYALSTTEERHRWIASYFNSHYPLDLPHASVIYDILTGGMLRYGRTLYECESCGRLWLQARPPRIDG